MTDNSPIHYVNKWVVKGSEKLDFLERDLQTVSE